MEPRDRLSRAHREAFGRPPEVIASAPGRVNLIGEHTDYNDGFVLPMAIERRIWAAAAPRTDGQLVLFAADLDQRIELEIDALAPGPAGAFSNYPAGVVAGLLEAGAKLPGLEMTVGGDVPPGAGLSSSAALEIACGLAAAALAGFELPGPELASLCQRAEHEYAGVRCGIMDQFVSRLAIAGHALFIDCRSLDHRPVALPEQCTWVVTDTRSPHKLAASAYNQRRAQCEAGLSALQALRPGAALRDYTSADLDAVAGELDETIARRCRHVIEENQRVLAAERTLSHGDLAGFGRLMSASHESLRELYEVSSPELDWLVERAQCIPGVYGARLTGAGFGGCTVTLCRPEAVAAYRQAVTGYFKRFGRPAELFVTRPGPGARLT